jgi:hypothetical protein
MNTSFAFHGERVVKMGKVSTLLSHHGKALLEKTDD